MAMIDASQAAQKIAAAAVGIERARKALPSPEYDAKVRAAERRLSTLLKVYKSFKDHPDFMRAYRREMSALCGEVETSASEEIVRLSFCGKVEIAN
jgi:hypothetical protein